MVAATALLGRIPVMLWAETAPLLQHGSPPQMKEVTRILSAIGGGDPTAARDLLPLVYEELRKLATQRIANEKPGQTLQATALVDEAYLRLVDVDPATAQRWNGRGHFFGAAAEAMRRILIERARRVARVRHGGGHRRLDLGELDSVRLQVGDPGGGAEELLALDAALSRLEAEDSKAAGVKLRYFAGLTIEDAAAWSNTARALGVDCSMSSTFKRLLPSDAVHSIHSATQPQEVCQPAPRNRQTPLSSPPLSC